MACSALLPPGSVVLQVQALRNCLRFFWAAYPKGTSYGDAEASPSGRSTQSAWKQCGARHARRNRVKCTVAKWFAQSTSESTKTLPRGSNGGRSPLGLSFSPIFLQTKKDGATGGRWFSSAAGKNVQRKISPPEVVTRRSRPVKPHNPSFAITKKHQRREQLRWCFSLRIGISPERSHIGTERKRGENRRWKHDADSCSHLTTLPAPVCE